MSGRAVREREREGRRPQTRLTYIFTFPFLKEKKNPPPPLLPPCLGFEASSSLTVALLTEIPYSLHAEKPNGWGGGRQRGMAISPKQAATYRSKVKGTPLIYLGRRISSTCSYTLLRYRARTVVLQWCSYILSYFPSPVSSSSSTRQLECANSSL